MNVDAGCKVAQLAGNVAKPIYSPVPLAPGMVIFATIATITDRPGDKVGHR
jgi:hypothetical protein